MLFEDVSCIETSEALCPPAVLIVVSCSQFLVTVSATIAFVVNNDVDWSLVRILRSVFDDDFLGSRDKGATTMVDVCCTTRCEI